MTNRLFCFLISLLIACTLTLRAQTPATTQIADVVYRADGTPAHGTLAVSWPAFTTAAGYAVAAGQMNVTLGPSGALNLQLIPNAGATPSGTFYKVLIHLDDGTQSTEDWVVPTASPTTVAAIRSTVLPSTVAAQFASVQYVNQAVTNAQAGSINVLSGIRFADKFANIQAAVADAASTGAVLIPSSYTGTDTYTNPNNIPVLDLRSNRVQISDLSLRDGLWRDVRSYGADCSGQSDSSAALLAAIQPGKKAVAPPGCKLKVLDQSLTIVASAWEFDGSGTWRNDPLATTIFGCGTGTGAVVVINRSADWKLHGLRIQSRGDISLCGISHPSTFTSSLEWDNTGTANETSTKAEIYNVALTPGSNLGTAGVFYPIIQSGKDCGGSNGVTCAPAPSNGNQVGYISVSAGGVPTGIHQETATIIASGTTYTLSLDISYPAWPAFISYTPSTAKVELTANGVVVATATPSLTQGVWTHVTLPYTATSATAGQALGVSITNTTVPTSGTSEIWFDNLAATNFILANPSFESPVLNPSNSAFPVPPNWQFTGAYPWIGLQVGSGTPTVFNEEQNLESGYFHDSSINGADLPGSIGVLGTGCCEQSWKFSNLQIWGVKFGIAGAMGYVAENINAGDVGAYTRHGAGGGLIATAGCANNVITLTSVSTTESSGPFFTSMYNGAANSPVACGTVVMINPQIAVPDIAPSDPAINTDGLSRLQILGGSAYSSQAFPAWVVGKLGTQTASVLNQGFHIDPASATQTLYGSGISGTDFNGNSLVLNAGPPSINNPTSGSFGGYLSNKLLRRLWGVNESLPSGSPLDNPPCATDSSICGGESGEIEIQSVPPQYPACALTGADSTGGSQIFALVALDSSGNKSMARYNYCLTPATYDAAHYPTLSWIAAPGAAAYDLLWCSDGSHCYKVANTTATSYNITSQPTSALPAYTIPTWNQTAVIKLRGQLQMAQGQLPAPTASTLGAVNSKDCGAQFVQKINNDGSITCAAAASGSGTVTSVGLSLPAMFSVTGSPVTASGTLTASLANQSANTVFAGPSSGAAAAPGFRTMVKADLPALACSDLSNGGTLCSSSAALPQTIAAVTHKRLASYDASTGAFTQSQLDYSDFSSATIPDVNMPNEVTAGSCGDTTHSCGLTYDAKGRITAATNNAISGGSSTQPVTAKSANYTVTTTDFSNSALFTFNCTGTCDATLPATSPVTNGQFVTLKNIGAASVFVMPNGRTIDGQAGPLLLAAGQSVLIDTDGTNYESGTGRTGLSQQSARRFGLISSGSGAVLNSGTTTAGTTGTFTNITPTSSEGYYNNLASGATSGNQAQVSEGRGYWGIANTSANVRWSARAGMDDGASGVTSVRAWFGLLDSNTTLTTLFGSDTPSANLLAFRCSSVAPDANWQVVVQRAGGTAQVVSSGTACSTANHTFAIQEHGGNTAYFYIDGSMVKCIGADTGCTAATNYPNAIGTAQVVGIATQTTAARNLHFFWAQAEADR